MTKDTASASLPFIQALIDGKQIQELVHGVWQDIDGPEFTRASVDYRIKPENSTWYGIEKSGHILAMFPAWAQAERFIIISGELGHSMRVVKFLEE